VGIEDLVASSTFKGPSYDLIGFVIISQVSVSLLGDITHGLIKEGFLHRLLCLVAINGNLGSSLYQQGKGLQASIRQQDQRAREAVSLIRALVFLIVTIDPVRVIIGAGWRRSGGYLDVMRFHVHAQSSIITNYLLVTDSTQVHLVEQDVETLILDKVKE